MDQGLAFIAMTIRCHTPAAAPRNVCKTSHSLHALHSSIPHKSSNAWLSGTNKARQAGIIDLLSIMPAAFEGSKSLFLHAKSTWRAALWPCLQLLVLARHVASLRLVPYANHLRPN